MGEVAGSADIVDTHMHFYDARFPSAPAALLHPPDATVAMYREVQADLGLDRVVVVQPTTYGLDNSCQLEAMAALGDSARGVMVIDGSVTARELEHLHALGVRGARFHMLPGGAVSWSALDAVAAKIAARGWHIQLQLNGRELAERKGQLAGLPVELVIDHVGRFMPPVAPDHPAFAALCSLLDSGRCWVKLSAPYESANGAGPRYPEVSALVDELVQRYPERLLWATNWPHPGQEHPPSTAELGRLLHRWLPDPVVRHRVLTTNPLLLYWGQTPATSISRTG